MAIYKELQLNSELLAYPIEIKLNAEDWYVRIGAPLHQVVQIRPHLFNPSLYTVSNPYGSSIFNLLSDRKHSNVWTVWKESTLTAELEMEKNVVTLHDKEDGHHCQFDVAPAETLTKQELQMLAAAIMDTWQLINKASAGASKAFA